MPPRICYLCYLCRRRQRSSFLEKTSYFVLDEVMIGRYSDAVYHLLFSYLFTTTLTAVRCPNTRRTNGHRGTVTSRHRTAPPTGNAPTAPWKPPQARAREKERGDGFVSREGSPRASTAATGGRIHPKLLAASASGGGPRGSSGW